MSQRGGAKFSVHSVLSAQSNPHADYNDPGFFKEPTPSVHRFRQMKMHEVGPVLEPRRINVMRYTRCLGCSATKQHAIFTVRSRTIWVLSKVVNVVVMRQNGIATMSWLADKVITSLVVQWLTFSPFDSIAPGAQVW